MMLYEEMVRKGLNPNKLTLGLAMTISYDRVTDEKIGIDNITHKTPEVNRN